MEPTPGTPNRMCATANGTVVFSVPSGLGDGSKKTMVLAGTHGKPCLHLAAQFAGHDAPRLLLEFIHHHGIKVLSVAGPWPSRGPGVLGRVKTPLAVVLAG